MTPALARVYDDLVAAAADGALASIVEPVRARFAERVGPFDPSDPWFEERSAASWDRVLVNRAVLDALEPRASASLAEPLGWLGRAQRGLFEVHPVGGTIDLVCAARGAAFRLAPHDDAATAMTRGGEGGWIDGHVVPTSEGVALLPGLLVHPAEATEPMRELLRDATLPFEPLLDALLAMRHRMASRSRMRARQIYRPDALPRG